MVGYRSSPLVAILITLSAWPCRAEPPSDPPPDDGNLPQVRSFLTPGSGLDASSPAAAPYTAPAELFSTDVHLPTLMWPEARFQKRFGLWEFDVRGTSSATPGVEGWANGLPASSANLSLTWRYHGLLNGVVRPVVGVSASATQAWLPPHWSQRSGPLWTLALAPNAGVEVVYRGLGVGWRASLPMGTYQTTPDGFYHPQLMGKQKVDWGTFFQGVMQNMYLIWDQPADNK